MTAIMAIDTDLDDLLSRVKEAGITELELLEWAKFVKLAEASVTELGELPEVAIKKILRSWDSVSAIIRLSREGI